MIILVDPHPDPSSFLLDFIFFIYKYRSNFCDYCHCVINTFFFIYLSHFSIIIMIKSFFISILTCWLIISANGKYLTKVSQTDNDNDVYQIGFGIGDITGPAAEINMVIK